MFLNSVSRMSDESFFVIVCVTRMRSPTRSEPLFVPRGQNFRKKTRTGSSVYYTDEELQKQVEDLVGKLVVTGQEMPGVAKIMWEDPNRNHISADRLPYATNTKQVELRVWKRFEMNDTPKFRGTTEVTFNSIYRRSMVTGLKGRSQLEGFLEWS